MLARDPMSRKPNFHRIHHVVQKIILVFFIAVKTYETLPEVRVRALRRPREEYGASFENSRL